ASRRSVWLTLISSGIIRLGSQCSFQYCVVPIALSVSMRFWLHNSFWGFRAYTLHFALGTLVTSKEPAEPPRISHTVKIYQSQTCHQALYSFLVMTVGIPAYTFIWAAAYFSGRTASFSVFITPYLPSLATTANP